MSCPTGGATLVFRKWDDALGTALVKPARLATLEDGHELAFMASNYTIGGTNRLDLQLPPAVKFHLRPEAFRCKKNSSWMGHPYP